MTIRRVRTPEGAEHYGQPIGSIITSDGDVNLPAKLKKVVDAFKKESYYDYGEQEDRKVADLKSAEHSVGQCSGSSSAFDGFGDDYNLDAKPLETMYGDDRFATIHYASVVDMDGTRWVIDYAFRQFEEDSPWPLVIPLDEYLANPAIRGTTVGDVKVKSGTMSTNPKEGGVMETKIRRVRTPEGVAKFGQPIGSIIVADAIPSRRRALFSRPEKISLPSADKPVSASPRAKVGKEKIDRRGVPRLDRATSPYKGWLAWQHNKDGSAYYVGPDPKRPGSYVAVDKSGKVIARGPSQGEAKIALDQTIGTYKPDKARDDYSFLKEDPSPKEIEAWQKKFGLKLPPGGQFEITTDESKSVIGRYIDIRGDVKNIQNPRAAQEGQVEKWKRVKELSKALREGALGEELAREALTDQTAAAVLLMRRTGMRAASSSDRQRGEEFAYGATNLLNSHISNGPGGSIVIEYVGKKGQRTRKEIRDPELIAAIKAHWDPNDKRGHLFPDTNSEKTLDYIREETGGDFENHDLRRYMGSLIAATYVKRLRGNKPRTEAEFKALQKKVAQEVADQLGNTVQQALNYYIDPAVWSAWKDGLP